jgi:pSer/pThr/pTyr-binding forkhead associated (FHA) protein
MEILLSISPKANGNGREVKCAIGEGLVVGRGAEEGILLDGPDLSREHLVLTTDGANVYVTDLSSNGTWLNGTRLRRSVRSRARSEDTIEVPGYVLKFRPAEQAEKEPEKKPEVPEKLPQAIAEDIPTLPAAAEPAAVPPSLLDTAQRFIGSFTFGEKFLIVVGLCGLLLLYTYLSS